MTVEKDKETLLKKCKESMEDVFGWKTFIFLPLNVEWRFLIVGTIVITYGIHTTEFFYSKSLQYFSLIVFACDFFYVVDTICATLHYIMVKTRELRYGRKRHLFFLFLDYLSLIPLNAVYKYLLYPTKHKESDSYDINNLNVCLRMYQISKTFSEIKLGLYKAKTNFAIFFLELFTYGLILTHLIGCFLYISIRKKYQKDCLDDFIVCVAKNELMGFSLLSGSFIHLTDRHMVNLYFAYTLIFSFLVGYFFTYGYIIPVLLFTSFKHLRGVFEYSNQWKQLKLLVKNMIQDKALKEKTLKYFYSTWKYGKGDRLPPIINVFPLCFQKSLFCDIYWEAMEHSDFLQCLSKGCKRSLSLSMKTEFLLPQNFLLTVNQRKTCFMYLESGLIQIMSEENPKSPVIAFSSGTVLGEMSLFLHTESKVIMCTGKFSVIHVLHFKDLFRVLIKYPKDVKKMISRMKLRLELAKATQKRKMEICPQFMSTDSSSVLRNKKLANIKWIKQQFRGIIDLEKSEAMKANRNQRNPLTHLHTDLQKTTSSLSLLAINDEVVSDYNPICLKKSCPWVVDPQSNFLVIWNAIILVVIFNVALFYPAFIGWFPYIPIWFVNCTVFVSFMYILDVLMQLFTGVKEKNTVITKFWPLLGYKLSSISFCIDILAALPLQVFIFYKRDAVKRFELNLYLCNALLKGYRLFVMFNRWNFNMKPGVMLRSYIKYLFFLVLFTYILTAIFYLSGIECLFYKCGEKDWYYLLKQKVGKKLEYNAPVFMAIFVALDVPCRRIMTNEFASYFIFVMAFLFFYLFFLSFQAGCISSYFLENSHELMYKNLMDFVQHFMEKRGIVGNLQKRVQSTMKFQWYYDYGNYLTQSNRILDDLSAQLREEIDRIYVLPTIRAITFFELEEEEFLLQLCKSVQRLALPANSLLIKFGTQTMCLYVIHKGYVQVSSFLPRDLVQNVGTPITFKSGDVFPVIVALNQMPAAISTRTLTDCELFILNLEDVLSSMMAYGIFKDVVEAVKATDLSSLSSPKLGLSVVNDIFQIDPKAYNAVFKRIKCIGPALKYFFMKKAIDSRSTDYLRWELSRVACIIIDLIIWPFILGTFYKSKPFILIYLILVMDSLSFIDFYIRFHVAFYNKIGIYVTHPLATSLHYLKTSFFVDVIAFAPHIHALYLNKDIVNLSLTLRIIHVCFRLLSLYRFMGYLKYIESVTKFFYKIDFVKYIIISLLIMHSYINYNVYLYLSEGKTPDFSFNHQRKTFFENPIHCYLNELSLMILLMFRIPFFFYDYSFSNMLNISLLVIIGWVGQIYFYAYLTLDTASESLNFTVYQYHMKSFFKYLNSEKSDDSISNQAMEQMEHQWKNKKGENVRQIFSRFPDTLHEDLMFPVYRQTLTGVECLSQANEAFYRTLSRNLDEIHLKKDSVVIFKNQVQRDIFFIHKGQCIVEKSSTTLYRGSMIGDIRQRAIMNNTIKTETHVELLKIPSVVFFLTMANFYHTKVAFESGVVDVEDYIQSIYVQKPKKQLFETGLGVDEENVVESEFEPVDDFVRDTGQRIQTRKKHNRNVRLIINPNSMESKVLSHIFLFFAYLTVISVPVIVGQRILTPPAIALIYVLDTIWFFRIVVKLCTAYVDPKTGDYIYNRKAIFRKYLRSNILIIDFITILPLELIPIIYSFFKKSHNYCCYISFAYSLRILRFIYVRKFITKERKKLSMNYYFRFLSIFGWVMFIMNLCYGISALAYAPHISKCIWKITNTEWRFLIKHYVFLLNCFVGAGMYIDLPKTEFQIFCQVCLRLTAFFLRAILINQLLMVLYVANHVKSNLIHELERLETYLMVRDVSPALFQMSRKYFCNLISTYREGGLPLFLKESPPFIRINIMKDLYMSHLSSCYLFQGISSTFLGQLSSRLERQIFFPGDYVTEKGDVDQSIYFVHKGEVYCINLDSDYPNLEIIEDLYVKGESFGALQGIYLTHPHTHTYRAKTLAEILVLNFNNWLDLRMAFPDITQAIFNKAQTYNK